MCAIANATHELVNSFVSIKPSILRQKSAFFSRHANGFESAFAVEIQRYKLNDFSSPKIDTVPLAVDSVCWHWTGVSVRRKLFHLNTW